MSLLAHQIIETPDPNAPTVVFIGSLGSTADMWNPQRRLADGHRMVLIDLPGHGDSPLPEYGSTIADFADAVIEVLDYAGLDAVYVVGLSIGGAIAQQLAITYPERIIGLVLLCTSARFGDPQAWRQRAADVRDTGLADMAPTIVRRWLTPDLLTRDRRLVERCTTMVASIDGEGYARCCEALAEWDSRSDLPRIACAATVVGGADDPATPPEHQRLIADQITRSEFTILRPAAHVASIEQAGPVTELIAEFVARSDTRRRAYRDGMRIRRAVLGDAHVDRSIAGTTAFTEPFQDFITRVAWGDIWARPGLDHDTRRLLTCAILTAVGNDHELDMHIRAALRAGISSQTLAEVFLHTAVYAGVPNSNRAFALGKSALADIGESGS